MIAYTAVCGPATKYKVPKISDERRERGEEEGESLQRGGTNILHTCLTSIY
jgi:hypothetical protein